MDTERWRKNLESERKQKDEFFKRGYQSPISFEERDSFKGLSYYPVNIKYRFELKLFEHSDKESIKIEDTKGNIREFIKWGEFRFNIDNTACKLQAYKASPDENVLFVPFKDLTSGKETYGAGRYLDLEMGMDTTPQGNWILDFNKAYNPWCAYSSNYACPFTPPENWLKVRIEAGEKYIHKEKGA